MATKTVVCPECGAGAAPGRFACAECGALLAAVGAFPRRWDAGSPGEDEPRPEAIESAPVSEVASDAEVEPEAISTVALEAASSAALAVAELEEVAEPESVPKPEPKRSVAPTPAAPAGASTPVPAASEPSWPERPQPVPVARPLPSVLGLIEPEADRSGSSVAADDAFDDGFEDDLDDDAPVAAVRAAAAARVWPPEGVPQPGPIPAARTPAGAYLSPSASIPPPDAPTVPRPAPVAAAVVPAAPSADDARASLSETLGAFGITEDIPHRLIGAGAAIAGLGFLLPWAAVLAGNGLGGSYWSRWGLAGPGHWIIVAGLIACVVVALAGDRLARVPIGPIAVVLAAVLIGLLWPYVFGVFERFVGVWLVAGGTLILGIGGILDVRRHEPEEPPV